MTDKNLECPVCTSSNVSQGISFDSANVVQVCNTCNFREVVFYADSPNQAQEYLDSNGYGWVSQRAYSVRKKNR